MRRTKLVISSAALFLVCSPAPAQPVFSTDGSVALEMLGSFGVTDMTWDGSVLVGFDANAFLASHGLTLNNFNVTSLTTISGNGRVIAGCGFDAMPPFEFRSFLIHLLPGAADAGAHAPATRSPR